MTKPAAERAGFRVPAIVRVFACLVIGVAVGLLVASPVS